MEEAKAILEEVRSGVEPGLVRVTEIMQGVAENAPSTLQKYVRELVSRKGKRLRATFVLLLSSGAPSDATERAALISSSIELLHLATLVHDDIIDESDMRRNGLTAHKKWGTRIAVLVGDFALSKALELIIFDEDNRIPHSISRASSLLVEGEVLEIERSGDINLSIDDYYSVIYGKTASLWETCGECGAIVAGFDEPLVKKAAKLGKDLGMAFQIIDDNLDYGYNASNLGKATHSDLQNGLITLPLILYFEGASAPDKVKMQDLVVNSENPESLRLINEKLKSHDIFQKTKEIALHKIENCIQIIDAFPPAPYTQHLRQLCDIMVSRTA